MKNITKLTLVVSLSIFLMAGNVFATCGESPEGSKCLVQGQPTKPVIQKPIENKNDKQPSVDELVIRALEDIGQLFGRVFW